MRRSAIALAGLLLAASCAGERPIPAEGEPDELPVLADAAAETVRAALVAGEGGTLVVRVDSPALVLGSVQGMVRFNPAELEVLEARPLTGAYTVVNLNDAARGELRFAAFAAEGLAGPDLASLTVRPIRPLSQVDASISLEVAGTVEGVSLPASRLTGTSRIFRVNR